MNIQIGLRYRLALCQEKFWPKSKQSFEAKCRNGVESFTGNLLVGKLQFISSQM
jgi:hypothetical protein